MPIFTNCPHCKHSHRKKEDLTLCRFFQHGYILPAHMTGHEPIHEKLAAMYRPKPQLELALDTDTATSRTIKPGLAARSPTKAPRSDQ